MLSDVFFELRHSVQRLLFALVSNACDAMPDGGTITVSTQLITITDETAFPHGVQPGRYIELSVEDTGIGMTPELQEPLVRTVLHHEARSRDRPESCDGVRHCAAIRRVCDRRQHGRKRQYLPLGLS